MRPCIVWALSSLLILAACSAPTSPPAAHAPSGFYNRVAQLVPGISTRGDVVRVFGSPHGKQWPKSEWLYTYPNPADPASAPVAASLPGGQIVLLYVNFDGEGVLCQVRTSAVRELPPFLLNPSTPDPNGPLASPDAPTG